MTWQKSWMNYLHWCSLWRKVWLFFFFPLRCQGWGPVLCSGAGRREIRINRNEKQIQHSWNKFSHFSLEREEALSFRHLGWESLLFNIFVAELKKWPGVVSWSSFLVINCFWRCKSKLKLRKVFWEPLMINSLKMSPRGSDPVKKANKMLGSIRKKMENEI